MYDVKGKVNQATVFVKLLDGATLSQIENLCDQDVYADSKIRIMPDAHAGKGCTIGTTMTIKDRVAPSLVGVDLGCGVMCMIIKKKKEDIDFEQLDKVIRRYVPSGREVHREPMFSALSWKKDFEKVYAPVNMDRALKSIGTLGSGNHLIEINEYDEDHIALVVHSGSRSFGASIAKHYQDIAYKRLTDQSDLREDTIMTLKFLGREREIESALKKIQPVKVNRDFAYVEGEDFNRYLHDVKIAQKYAHVNRLSMMNIILSHMDWWGIIEDSFDTVHNYIDTDNMILRKGAISAQKGERVIIPLNMRDGSIIAYGKGNPDWNYSAPHGAGRVMSRTQARKNVNLEEFKETMSNVWTSSVSENTLDEAPMAYKPMEDIIDVVGDTLEIERIMKPLYNFKAEEEFKGYK